jgi:hypothetical protein
MWFFKQTGAHGYVLLAMVSTVFWLPWSFPPIRVMVMAPGYWAVGDHTIS